MRRLHKNYNSVEVGVSAEKRSVEMTDGQITLDTNTTLKQAACYQQTCWQWRVIYIILLVFTG